MLAAFTLFRSDVAGADSEAGTTSGGARAVIRDASGAFVGTLTLHATRRGTVVAEARVNGLTAGFHGFHVHAAGVCDARTTDPAGNPAPFLSAGGHFDPAGGAHGQHAGDMPALLVSRGGTATSGVETDRFTIAGLFDADGSAVIVHAAVDNHANIPARYTSSTTGQPGADAATLATGDAGGRFACGVITRR